jgi:hypothetical protein
MTLPEITEITETTTLYHNFIPHEHRIDERTKHYISPAHEVYFRVYDYDIRFFREGKSLQFFGINTYPMNPKDFLKKVSNFEEYSF